jgi:protein-disulfide isomerase
MTAHACGFAAALLCLKNIPLAADPDTPMWTTGSGKRGVPRQAVFSLVLIGLAGVAVLAGGQVLVQKQRNVVKVLPVTTKTTASTSTNHSTPQALGGPSMNQPASPNARLIAPRSLSLYSNQFLIKLDDVPMIGSPDSPHIIVYLFDYTCSHCRALHPILVKTCQRLTNQLGVVCLPMSISPQCNPFLPRTSSHADSNSCEYARLGLAVWRAKPEAQRQFDDWMFAAVKPPPLEQAREYAAQLVGADKLKSALADPWIQQQFLTDCRLHRANWLAVDSSAMPQIIMGDAVSSGPLNSVEHLLILLNRYLGMDVGLNRR